MIVVDTSALMAIVLVEAEAGRCATIAVENTGQMLISAVSLAEALIVSARRERRLLMEDLLDRLNMSIVPVDDAAARAAPNAYDRWGKGVHRADLNICDCFAYALAKARDCPLLFVGNDFAQTDIAPAG